jgi:hypothetical protein
MIISIEVTVIASSEREARSEAERLSGGNVECVRVYDFVESHAGDRSPISWSATAIGNRKDNPC